MRRVRLSRSGHYVTRTGCDRPEGAQLSSCFRWSCSSCHFLLLELASFRGKLRLNHFRNQVVLVAR